MSITATTPEFRVITRSHTVIKNVTLEGVTSLNASKITTTFAVKYRVNPKTHNLASLVSRSKVGEVIETVSFDLVEITPDELAKRRKSGISSFVLKTNGTLYYTQVPKDINFVGFTLLGSHLCSLVGSECRRLSAASDNNGGCEKVRDLYKCIEKYPWITKGYETFNTELDVFAVIRCSHYEKCPPREKVSFAQLMEAKRSLAMYLSNLKNSFMNMD